MPAAAPRSSVAGSAAPRPPPATAAAVFAGLARVFCGGVVAVAFGLLTLAAIGWAVAAEVFKHLTLPLFWLWVWMILQLFLAVEDWVEAVVCLFSPATARTRALRLENQAEQRLSWQAPTLPPKPAFGPPLGQAPLPPPGPAAVRPPGARLVGALPEPRDLRIPCWPEQAWLVGYRQWKDSWEQQQQPPPLHVPRPAPDWASWRSAMPGFYSAPPPFPGPEVPACVLPGAAVPPPPAWCPATPAGALFSSAPPVAPAPAPANMPGGSANPFDFHPGGGGGFSLGGGSNARRGPVKRRVPVSGASGCNPSDVVPESPPPSGSGGSDNNDGSRRVRTRV